MKHRLFPLISLIIALAAASVLAQDITGGGSLVRDITGGAALIFRAPQNPSVSHAGGQTPGGGRIRGRAPKPQVPKQDQIIARANAARSAPRPRYAEAEEQYQLAAKIAPDDARAH
ncbi:MAG TPA: hypothetical protein VFT02_14225, partial [Pyrinomonadaceae bacterium]|nr:hypothetical protein [Pyrinomonadaceae bacterium]